MKFLFADEKLERLYLEGFRAHKLPPEVYFAFQAVMQIIQDAPDERALYAAKALNMEKLIGNRKGQFSVRLNKQFRLCFEILKDQDGNTILLLEIVDYH